MIAARVEKLVGTRVRDVTSLTQRDRVFRCRTDSGSVIAKVGAPQDAVALERFAPCGRTPRLLAADADLTVMEDLAGERLDAKLLRAGDPDAAAALLVELATALGTLHAAAPEERSPERVGTEGFEQLCDALGLPFTVELPPASAFALTQHDVGPDNCLVTPEGLRLFDFELAAPRDPLTDAAAWRMDFPNCGGAGALPAVLCARMDDAYGRALGRELPAEAFVRAHAERLVERVGRLHGWRVLDDDWDWGRATGRQRVLALLRGFPRRGVFPAFERQLDRLYETLRARWPSVPDTIPVYPALESE
ncbi:MAG: phosphotransferase family protein [Planctomycetota bacterium]